MGIQFLSIETRGKGHSDLNSMQHPITPICIPNMGFLCHILHVYDICSAHDFNRPVSEVKVTLTKNSKLQSTTPKCTQTRNFRKYTRDTIFLGQLRPEVKVTVTQKIVHTALHTKMQTYTEFGIPTSNIPLT